MDQNTFIIICVALLAAVCIGAAGFVIIGAREEKSNKRLARVSRGPVRSKIDEKGRDDHTDNAGPRRKQVQETLKELEENQLAEAALAEAVAEAAEEAEEAAAEVVAAAESDVPADGDEETSAA